MIPVAEARKIILDHCSLLSPVSLPLNEAAGLVLAEDIFSPLDIPAYDQSSMDGYAISFQSWKEKGQLLVEGERAAGSDNSLPVEAGKAVRIFTGAPVPPGSDTVVMQEKTKLENGFLLIADENLQQGTNVRSRGSEIKKGDMALGKNALLSPPAIGFLAGIGITHAKAYPSPAVGIIVTGNELQQPGNPLGFGQVYESNSFSLQAALKQLHIPRVKQYQAADNLEALTEIMGAALRENDVLFLTGGVSVGDYDFVAQASQQNGVEKIFHKIRQRPGKPLFFGKKGGKLVFGLPGNPASVLTCFYIYAGQALKKMQGRESSLRAIKVPLASAFKKAAGLTHFLKGYYDGESATPLSAQESYRLSTFARANCLIQVDEEVTQCEKGEPVIIHLLPF